MPQDAWDQMEELIRQTCLGLKWSLNIILVWSKTHWNFTKNIIFYDFAVGNIYQISCSMTSFPLCELLALYILVHDLSCLWMCIGTATRLSGNSADFMMTFSLGQSVWKVKLFLGLTFLLTHRHKTDGDDWQANHPDKSVSKIWGHILVSHWKQCVLFQYLISPYYLVNFASKVSILSNQKQESGHLGGATTAIINS